MNLVPFVAAVTITCGVLASQVNLAEIYPGSNCTNFTSRGSLGSNGGEILLEWPETHFSGIGHDLTGRGTILSGFVHVVQDQYAATPSTYSVLVRRGVGGRPSTDAAGILLQAGPFSLPPGSGTIAWIITIDLATPSTALPPCDTFYYGMASPAQPGWPGDGLSWHMASATTMFGTPGGDNPAGSAAVPNLAWDRIAGTLAPTQPLPRTYHFGLRVAAAALNLGNVDPTWTSSCASSNNFTSFGLGGMWPQITGSRSDGLSCRVRDAAHGNGTFFLFSSPILACPGVPLPGLALGALYIDPSTPLVPVTMGSLGTNGEGSATIAAPRSVPSSLLNRLLDFQAFTLGPTMALPGKLTNRASTRFL